MIGDGTKFVEHVKKVYANERVKGKNTEKLDENPQQVSARTQENIAKIQEEMRKKKGMTLKEQIDKQLQKVKKYDVVKHIDDSFFSQCEENGCLF